MRALFFIINIVFFIILVPVKQTTSQSIIKSFRIALLIPLVCFTVSNLFGAGGALITIMPLGDSITQGNFDWNSYRRPLWQKLQTAGYFNVDFVGSHPSNYMGDPPNPDFDMDNEGYWGATSFGICANLKNTLKTIKPDIVLMHVGTNDLTSTGNNPGGLKTPQQLLDTSLKIIETLRSANPNVVVLMAQLIPRSGDASNVIGQFNALVPAFVAAHTTTQSPLVVVDQNTGFNTATDAADGTHPSPSGEEKMATKWFAALTPFLSSMTGISPVIAPRSGIFDDSVQVTVKSPLSGVAIRYTTDNTKPGKNSALYSAPLSIKNNTIIKTRGYLGSDSGFIDSVNLTLLHTITKPAHAGLQYKYYEYPGAAWDSLAHHDLSPLTPARSGMTDSFCISMKRRDDRFAVHLNGALQIDTPGKYTFYVFVHAGAKLYIDSACIVNADGRNTIITGITGTAALTKGFYPISLDYFQDSTGSGSPSLGVYYLGPGFTGGRIKIAKRILFCDSISTAAGQPVLIRAAAIGLSCLHNRTIAVSVSGRCAYELRLIRFDGKTVQTIKADRSALYRFTPQVLPSGIYLVKVAGAGEITSAKMLLY
jgi:lysophospholipase L1-like esterase